MASKKGKEIAQAIVDSIRTINSAHSDAVQAVLEIGKRWKDADKSFSAKSVNRKYVLIETAKALDKDEKAAREYLSRAKTVYLVANGQPPEKYEEIDANEAEDILYSIDGISPVSMLRAFDKAVKAKEQARKEAAAKLEEQKQKEAEAARIAEAAKKAEAEAKRAGKEKKAIEAAGKKAAKLEVKKIEAEKNEGEEKPPENNGGSEVNRDLSIIPENDLYRHFARLGTEVIARLNKNRFGIDEVKALQKLSELLADAAIDSEERLVKRKANGTK